MNLINKFVPLFALTCCIALIVSCKKDVDLPVDTCVAGTGGEVTLVLQPEHHGEPIPSLPAYPDSAFIKFNVNEFPGDNPSLYDLIVVGLEGENEVTINNLKCGDYYVFMTGKDTSIDERVKGGVPVVIEQTSGVKTIKVAITED